MWCMLLALSPTPEMPRLPRRTKVHVTKCHTCHAERKIDVVCHAKRRTMPPSATPATQNEGPCHQAPRLPRKTQVDVAERHACHAKRRRRHRRHAQPSGPKRATRPSPVPEEPRLPRKTKVHVTKCQTCPAKGRSWQVHVAKCHACHATAASLASRATKRNQARHQSQPSATSGTPATQNEGGCRQVTKMCVKGGV